MSDEASANDENLYINKKLKETENYNNIAQEKNIELKNINLNLNNINLKLNDENIYLNKKIKETENHDNITQEKNIELNKKIKENEETIQKKDIEIYNLKKIKVDCQKIVKNHTLNFIKDDKEKNSEQLIN